MPDAPASPQLPQPDLLQDYKDLLNFEKSTRFNARQKAALAYTETIVWDLPSEDALWQRLHEHFSEPELVELGYFVALTMGQQRWLRTLNIEHHKILAAHGLRATYVESSDIETEEQESRANAPETNPDGDNWHPGDAPSQALQWAVRSLAKAGTLTFAD